MASQIKTEWTRESDPIKQVREEKNLSDSEEKVWNRSIST